MVKRAVGYIRVSTAQQAAEDKVSLEEQRKDIEAYCEEKGYELGRIYQDVGYSGATKRRPEFQEMLRDIPEDQFPLLLASVKRRAAEIVRQAQDLGAQRAETNLRRQSQRKNWRAKGGIKTNDYGRKRRITSVHRRNPLFDKN